MDFHYVLCLAVTASKLSLPLVSHLLHSDPPLQFVPSLARLYQHVCQSLLLTGHVITAFMLCIDGFQ